MFTNIKDLTKEIKKQIYSLVIKDGWVKMFSERNSDNINESIRSFIANINNIDQHSPFRDTDDDFEFPYVRLKKEPATPFKEVRARNIVVEIRDSRDGSINPELNQELKIIMGLQEQKNLGHEIFSKKRKDGSLEKSIILNNNSVTAQWLHINEILNEEECVVINFYYEFKCSSALLLNIKKDFKTVRLRSRNLILERFANEGGSFIRISGKKLLKKIHTIKSQAYFKVGYKDNGDIAYSHIHKHMNIPDSYQIKQIFFDRQVLTKYEQSQYFVVGAMALECETWHLQIFNNQNQIVSVLFPHIVEQLPEEEYLHWIAYNILPSPDDLLMTEGEYDTAAMGLPHIPDRNDHIFKNLITDYYQGCDRKKINPILKRLNAIDAPYFNTLNLISENSQWHFDLQILSLSKILIESIDTKELSINRKIENKPPKNMLKEYLGTQQQELCNFLDNLYLIRLGAAHRRANMSNRDYYAGLEYFRKKYGQDLVKILNGIFKEACILVRKIMTLE